jgi:hypothetical protein
MLSIPITPSHIQPSPQIITPPVTDTLAHDIMLRCKKFPTRVLERNKR